MADKTIGDLTAASALGGSELLEVEQSGNSRKVAVDTALSDRGVLVKGTENQGPLTGGASVTVKDLGNLSGNTITLDPGDRNAQKVTNNGAGSIAPHGSLWGSGRLIIANTTGAGAITTTAWDLVDGDSFDTTTTSVFICGYEIYSEGSVLSVKKVT